MDKDTLPFHDKLWVREAERHDGDLPNLTPEEAALYEDLRHDRLGQNIRLEQERIGYTTVQLYSVFAQQGGRGLRVCARALTRVT